MIQPGTNLNQRYLIVELMGREDFGEVWSARDVLLRRMVSVKILANPILKNLDSTTMFIREAQTLAVLEHPNIIPIYDYGVHEQEPYIVLRFMTSGTLLDLLNRQGALPGLDVLRLAQRLAGAIDFLHSHHIIHGNLKPTNILIGEQNHPYLTDFGISRQADASGTAENPGAGTLLFMAPEQMINETFDYRVDLYAFGVTIFQLLAGQPPLVMNPSGEDMPLSLGLLGNLVEKMPSVRAVRPDIPLAVDVVLARMLSLNPADRYPTATEMADALYKAFYSPDQDIEGRVFISYARKDQEYVHALAKYLRQLGIELWIDQDIAPGKNWDKMIESALNQCDKMLLVLSPAAAASENVQDEWSFFLEQGKPVYPFVYQPCDLSFRLRRRQYIQGSGHMAHDVPRIIEMLAGGTPTAIRGEMGDTSGR